MNHSNKKTVYNRKENGVDISNPSRYYSPEKWNKLSQSTRATLLRNPEKIADKKKIESRYTKKNTMKNTTRTYDQSEILENINAVFKSLHHVSPPHGGAVVSRLPANGINAGSTTNVSGIVASVQSVLFNHNGDPV